MRAAAVESVINEMNGISGLRGGILALALVIATRPGALLAKQTTPPAGQAPKSTTPASPATKDGWRALSDEAMTLFKDGKLAEAESLLKQSLAEVEKELGPKNPNVARILNELAYVDSAQGKYPEAEPLFQRAVAIVEKSLGKDNANLASVLRGLASAYAAEGKYAEAEPLFRRALAIAEKSYGPDHANVAAVLAGYAELLRKTGKADEAAQMDARARKIRGEPSGDTRSAAASPTPGAKYSDRGYDARVAYRDGDYATALKLFRELADEGDAGAQAALGDMYMEGKGVKADSAEAARWWRKSADQGFAGAQLNLGACYESGWGVPKDPAEAVRWYRKAADQGDAKAYKYMGDMYARGIGVPKDPKEAQAWYDKARATEGAWAAGGSFRPPGEGKSTSSKDMMSLGLRAVDLQDEIGILEWAVPKGVRVTLGREEVTSANGNEVLARLKAERTEVDRTMEQMGAKTVAGDYELTEPPKAKCRVFGQRPLQYPVK